jgi:hypothetical protein
MEFLIDDTVAEEHGKVCSSQKYFVEMAATALADVIGMLFV